MAQTGGGDCETRRIIRDPSSSVDQRHSIGAVKRTGSHRRNAGRVYGPFWRYKISKKRSDRLETRVISTPLFSHAQSLLARPRPRDEGETMRRFGVLLSVFALPLMLVLVLARRRTGIPRSRPTRARTIPFPSMPRSSQREFPAPARSRRSESFTPAARFTTIRRSLLRRNQGRSSMARRLFVASSSNFGAPLARQLEAPGAILSLDVSGGADNPVAVPADFAHWRWTGHRSRRQSHSL